MIGIISYLKCSSRNRKWLVTHGCIPPTAELYHGFWWLTKRDAHPSKEMMVMRQSVYNGIYHRFMAIQYTLEHDYKSVVCWADPFFRHYPYHHGWDILKETMNVSAKYKKTGFQIRVSWDYPEIIQQIYANIKTAYRHGLSICGPCSWVYLDCFTPLKWRVGYLK